MANDVEQHYGRTGTLIERIAAELRGAGANLAAMTQPDLEAIDEFHVRGRRATLELASRMEINRGARVLDIGSGLGGPARTVASRFDCHVTGIDLTADFCDAAQEMSRWVGLADRVDFKQGDVTALDVEPASFDAAMSIHVGMNIAQKDAVYDGVYRALKHGRIFAIYDIVQGEGGEVLYPVPWAREPSISHLATPAQMRHLLEDTGFKLLEEIDSSEESAAWFKDKAGKMQAAKLPTLGFKIFLGESYAQMTANQVRNLAERRIKTVTFVARK
ncbi:MAG: class I SAM-dependent methyltransferase [Hyphomicrobiales bacterium]|nr:MAG: class I SAM-dependent methyltransferase [Hyphomicrobiales bacterium]